MFRGCTFEEQRANSKNDGGFYQAIFSKDGILWGCEMTTTNDSFTMQPGELIISGRVIWVDGATQIPFTSPIQNGYGQVLLTIDLSKTATKEAFDQVEASVVYSTTSLFPELTQGEINTSNGDMVYQQELAVVSIAGGNITGITRQIEGVEIDAEKLGGQPPEYYMPKAGGTFEGPVTFQNFPLFKAIKNIVQIRMDYTGSDGLYDFLRGDGGWAAIQVNGLTNRAYQTTVYSSGGIHTFVVRGGSQFNFTDGTQLVDCAARSFTPSSDERLKENIGDMPEEYAEKLFSLAPVLFNFIGQDERQVGFIAQQVQPYFPELVKTTAGADGEELLMLNYDSLSAILTKVMQIERRKRQELEKRIEALERK